ncbi:MAG: tRNA (N(6)-L-threonylcarbamoyladenosine(37)-C(2))-methylthiotransferase MtaB [Proteobacteria bacterium]|nr:tRNA (N(6)-L-threonylcarbamoyladenosine(37)-C(2))-methylthiotransferase MtaB [Pseudomonadota bacterium]
MKYQLHTFGCKVNTYDSGLIQKNLSKSGFAQSLEAGIHVLNTCAVTGEATKEAVKLVRRIKSKDPLALIVVTGCAAQVDTGSFENLPGVDLVVANSHKGFLPQLIDQHYKGTLTTKVFKSNIFRKEDLEFGGGEESTHTRSFLKIQDGCNQFCSYCIIPYARGKSRSISIRDLFQRVNELFSQGVQEVVLTGVHIGDYEDQGKVLEDLLESLLLKTKMPRFRLSSIEPIELSDRLLELYQDPRMCAHFHMSIQSANDKVLKDMKRKYGQKEVIESLQKIQAKVPSAFVGMDVIVGFPTETDEDFEDTYQALMNTPWSRIHVFPYSERQGTKAAVMSEAVRREVRMERAGQLRSLSLHRYQTEGLSQVGRFKKALVLKKQSKGAQALSRDFWPIAFSNPTDLEKISSNQEVNVKIESFFMNEQRMDGVLRGNLHV